MGERGRWVRKAQASAGSSIKRWLCRIVVELELGGLKMVKTEGRLGLL